MVASKTSFIIAAVALGAASSVYAAPTPFTDLASRGFDDDEFLLAARFFDDDVELDARALDDASLPVKTGWTKPQVPKPQVHPNHHPSHPHKPHSHSDKTRLHPHNHHNSTAGHPAVKDRHHHVPGHHPHHPKSPGYPHKKPAGPKKQYGDFPTSETINVEVPIEIRALSDAAVPGGQLGSHHYGHHPHRPHRPHHPHHPHGGHGNWHKKPKPYPEEVAEAFNSPAVPQQVAERGFDDLVIFARSLGLDDDYFLEARSFDDDMYEY